MNTWIKAMVKYRRWVLAASIVATLGLVSQLKSLSIIIDPDNTLPQTHPYIVVGNEIEKVFGNKFTVVVGITAKESTVFQTDILKKVQRITAGILTAPGVVKSNVNSLAARKAKSITGTAEGMEVRQLMETVPETEAGLANLRAAVATNPVYDNLLISKDAKTAQVVAEFKRLPGGMKEVETSVRKIVEPELDDSVEINVAGQPIFLSQLERYSARMGFLFPIAVFIIGLIHYEAFRTLQALILPLITALVSVAWAVGFLALTGQPMDVFNASTPILILAIAAGHAVQILKRYYEEFAKLKTQKPQLSPVEANHQAVINSLTKVGPVMIVACTIAALGFFSLLVFEIKTIRTFGVFTGMGILSALVLELTLIPALRSMLPPPGEREYQREQAHSFWDNVIDRFYQLVTLRRKQLYITAAALLAILSLGGYWLRIDNSQKSYFGSTVRIRTDDDAVNARMAGTNTIYLLVDSGKEDGIKNPEILKAMEKVQDFLMQNEKVGKTVSLADFIKRMNKAMNADKNDFNVIPSSSDLVAQYLLLYSNSGDPTDFDSFVDYGYQRATVQAFLKTDSSAYIDGLIAQLRVYAASVFPPDTKLSIGGGSSGGVALNEVMIREKVLNIVQIMGAVFLVSSLVFRSILAGLLILTPLIAAVFVNFGIMGLLGIPLQIATALVSAMAVGIGADYGIYMSYRLKEELATGDDEEKAVARAFRSAGKAAIFVSTAVAGGFGVLMLSFGFMIHLWMGFLIGTAMLVSSVSALTLFPALIFSLRPKFIFGGRKHTMETHNHKTTALGSLLFALISMPLIPHAHAATAVLSAEEIMKRSYAAVRTNDSTSDSTFKLVNANGQERVRETTGKTKLIKGTTDNRRYVQFLSPSDVKGTKTLLVEHSGSDDDIWIYLPALKKTRRLVSSDKKSSFVGTDFSYGDVIGHKVEDWNHKLVKEETIDGKPCFVIESTPKTPEVGQNSGYSKRVGWIEKESFIAIKGEGYDSANALSKRFSAKKLEKVDAANGKWQPMEISAEDVSTGHKTIIEFRNYKANVGVGDEVFTARYLERQ
jgi:uncharacterized protein